MDSGDTQVASSRASLLAKFFRAAAVWEAAKNGDVPEDVTTLAHGLGCLADYVERLPETDSRLIHMAEAGYFDTGEFRPGPSAQELFRNLQPSDLHGPEGLILTYALAGSAVEDLASSQYLEWLDSTL